MSVRFVMKSFVKASRASVADLYPTIGSRQSRARTNDYYRSVEVPMSKFFFQGTEGRGGERRTGPVPTADYREDFVLGLGLRSSGLRAIIGYSKWTKTRVSESVVVDDCY